MTKSMLFVCVLALAGTLGAFAQSNEVVDAILTTDALDYGKAAYLVLVASDNIAEDAGESRSFEMLKELKWVRESVNAADPVTLADYSYFLMKAFGLKGGLMYAIAPGPRYAYRELVKRQVIQGRADPQAAVTGERAVRLLGRVLDQVGD